ncbi:MAG: NADH-quinone oxidoreductase subunit NuoK [Rectinemataceae bacterium]|jgi:NADH:ubiquinone oxidoreductase subunit K
MIGLTHYLILAALLFSIGLLGAIAKRNAISVFMGIELMLNSVNINFVAFNHFLHPQFLAGQAFAIFVIVVAAAEVSVGLAIILALYRRRANTGVDELDLLKW